MSIVIVGGNNSVDAHYQDIRKKSNCKSKVFTQMPADFEKNLRNPDLIVVFTEICSHKMLGTVKKSSEKSGVPVEQIISSRVSALKEFLSGIKGGNYVRTRKT